MMLIGTDDGGVSRPRSVAKQITDIKRQQIKCK
ncbi:hypothetical protein YPPY54_4284, partial [Yersinia pestis PY-54]